MTTSTWATMVHLTTPAAVRVTQGLGRKADDLMLGKRFGRKAIQDKDVPFIERLPLSLNNLVSNGSSTKGQKACMEPMMAVIACLGKFDQNQAMCGSEIAAFNKCFATFKASAAKAKAFRESGELPLGPYAKMTGPQMNKYMAQFPQGPRRGVAHADNVYKPGARGRKGLPPQ